MIYLKPIIFDNINDFEGTSYDEMPFEQKKHMIRESIDKIHNGKYFEILTVYKKDTVIGFMNLFAHSEHTISCGPEIKELYRKKGYGFQAELMALEYAKENGYTIAVSRVNINNAASIALHESLGFEIERKYMNEHGKATRLYIKSL